jgi:hypothetical protein
VTTKTRNAVHLYTISYVANFFACMLNPIYVGTNFTWEKFPELVSRLARSSLYMSVILKDTEEEAAELLVQDIAVNFATQLVRSMQEGN